MDETIMRERIEAIRAVALDDEHAHVLQDRLLWEFVEWRAAEQDDPLALMLLEVQKIKFDRWCA